MRLIRFLPRVVAAAYRPTAGSVLVSIHDVSEAPLVPQPGWAAVLTQRFHDTDGTLMGLEVFSRAQAAQVLAFAEQHAECDEFVVHCQMGASRSAAVALFLSEKYGVACYKQSAPVTWESLKVYNRLVYRQLMNVDNGLDY